MSTDDTMRRIEEALDDYGNAEGSIAVGGFDAAKRCKEAKDHLLATIRAALQPDAGGWGEDDDRHRANEEHERAVEAWAVEATCLVEDGFYILERREIDEALRLMRRQPTVQKPSLTPLLDAAERCAAAEAQAKAAGELLRAAKATIGYCRKQSIDPLWAEKLSVRLVEMEVAIEAAERAGVKP